MAHGINNLCWGSFDEELHKLWLDTFYVFEENIPPVFGQVVVGAGVPVDAVGSGGGEAEAGIRAARGEGGGNERGRGS